MTLSMEVRPKQGARQHVVLLLLLLLIPLEALDDQ